MKLMSKLYNSLLWLSLAVMPSAALAVEPVIDGNKTTTDVSLNSVGAWNNMLSTQVVIPANSIFHCEVTCTSTANVPYDGDSDNSYYYAAFNSVTPSVTDGCVRLFDTKQDAGNIDDVNKMVVATTCFIPSLSGVQTFYCLGQKLAAGDLNLTVDNSSMHVICVDNQG